MSEWKIISQRELTPTENKIYKLQQENRRLRTVLEEVSYTLSFNTYHSMIKAEEIVNKAIADFDKDVIKP